MSENGDLGKLNLQGPVCPRPLTHDERVVMGHGSGGKMTQDLIARIFYPPFGNPALLQGDDSAVVMPPSAAGRLAITTDAHIVAPLFFPGGDIGRLAVCGTVNDMAMVGAQPRWLTASFILEEGLSLQTLEGVALSMQQAAEEAGVWIVAGDTKVAERGKADGIFITTSGVGWIPEDRQVSGAHAQPGDAVLLSGSIGEHGIAVLSARGELAFETTVQSDVAPLNGLTEAIFKAGCDVHGMRDPTRGGVATALNEIAKQSDVAITIQEDAVPVRNEVQGACELLGFDPLYVANEGKFLTLLPQDQAEAALDAMRALPTGVDACQIGTVDASPRGKVLLRTGLGTTRVVDVMAGEMLPRIC